MPSSTSSSESGAPQVNIPGLRLTASDRPGVAQPVPERDIPQRPWSGMLVVALLLFTALMAGWEWQWRAYGAHATPANSDGLWAEQRRRIDHGEGSRTVIAASSRLLFDLDLDTWERLAGARPIQLALEGTSPLPVVEDLAADPLFTGRLIIGVAPQVFFGGGANRESVIKFYHRLSPSDRLGQWLSLHLIEPVFAFDDPDFALATVVLRQDWPGRHGIPARVKVRKLSESAPDRNAHMWSKVENDADYRELARSIWRQGFVPPDATQKAENAKQADAQITRAVVAIAKLRARGVSVLFVRPPSTGAYLEYENRELPRAATWDVLLAKTGVPGLHFQDYPELQGYDLPEWSHLATHEKPRFTEALYGIVARDFWKP